MPCSDGWSSADEARAAQQNNRKLEAVLCAIFTVLDHGLNIKMKDVLDRVDWDEAGIKRAWLENWWIEHKAQDAARRREEKRDRALKRIAKIALAKLSRREREALGL